MEYVYTYTWQVEAFMQEKLVIHQTIQRAKIYTFLTLYVHLSSQAHHKGAKGKIFSSKILVGSGNVESLMSVWTIVNTW